MKKLWKVTAIVALFGMVLAPNWAHVSASGVVIVSAGGTHSIVAEPDGSLWAWGCNEFGQLGTGVAGAAVVRIAELAGGAGGLVGGAIAGAKIGAIVGPKGAIAGAIIGGVAGGLVMMAVGRQVGGWLDFGRDAPVQVAVVYNWDYVSAGLSHTVAIRRDGSLLAWGNNAAGQSVNRSFGPVPNLSPFSSPTRVGRDNDWVFVSAGLVHTMAIRSDGTLWGWGDNQKDQIGVGSSNSRRTPTQVGGDTNWAFVSAGTSHTVAIRRDGSLWAWGNNGSGQIGDNTTTSRRSPTRIGFEYNWASASAGMGHTVAIRTDGSLWIWGDNRAGQLGDGSIGTLRVSPYRIGTATDWVHVSAGADHTVAIRANGSLWAWGNNTDGKTGLDSMEGTTNSPTRIGMETDWVSASAGLATTVAARADGSVWAWGNNESGQVGDGSQGQNRAIPIRVRN